MKMARGRELLTPEQRQAFIQIPEDEWVLGTYYTCSDTSLSALYNNKLQYIVNMLLF
ncbi:hypothetical protein V7024_19630 [Bacillus sp. JJ864]|uniref:hypothetical protein n=1 Tax=Bacillus sp. JJ864 TaxID=3122975 RepID=UPI003000876C